MESRRKILRLCENEERLSDLKVQMTDFETALKVVQPAAKREGFASIPDVTWKDVGAMEQVRRQIELKVLARVNHPEAAKDFNLDSPTGVLLVGPPGCGKTLVAKAVANQAGINFISVKGPELLNMVIFSILATLFPKNMYLYFQYVGESEKAVRQVFQRAKNSAPCVIFFDEIDALCPQRTGGSDHSGSNRVVTQMLTEMDGIEGRQGVYIMGATNRENIIDPAIKRPGRLETILYVGLPSAQDRSAILKAITKNGTRPSVSKEVDFENISEACDGYSGADLKALVTKASEIAFSQAILNPMFSSRQVTKEHFYEALKHIKPSVQGKEKIRYEKTRDKLMSKCDESVILQQVSEIQDLVKDTCDEKEADQEMDVENSEMITENTENETSEKDPETHENDKKDTEKCTNENVEKPMTEKNDKEDIENAKKSEKTHENVEEVTAKLNEDLKAADKSDDKITEMNGNGNHEKENGDKSKGDSEMEIEEDLTKIKRFLPMMATRILKSDKNKHGGKLAKVLKQLEKGEVLVLVDRVQEISVRAKDLEPFMPNPGEKAKSLEHGETENEFEVLKYDIDDDESVVVKNLADDEETTIRLENLCRINP